ncbi:HEPN domain-containing protein [Magnetospirillum sp. 64-120]|uniref:HEPN domain-containing protein n=1 Tax=Magnetospirillum sp. 64-120 TaxID=1895778 RepID=UPI00092A70D0|nr:HEPN domain-containing protein [Magnetospirillum sp. 64-120]OJX74782.1 MAG: hypothetical protein BGO92_14675 [Magnetospirillum sp. 64-120]
MTPADISQRLDQNLGRVDNLVAQYNRSGKGRRDTHKTDVLRAAVVLLHAALEDFIRSHLIISITSFTGDTLDSYGFPTDDKRPQEKIKISELIQYGNEAISDFINKSVRDRIERFETFNNPGDIKKALQKCRFDMNVINRHDFSILSEMISRRHQIVHKADRNENIGGRGNHPTVSIGGTTVDRYIKAVRAFKTLVENTAKVP